LRNLDRSRECWLRNYCRKPKSIGIAETKCHPGRQKDYKMLEIMLCAGRWPAFTRRILDFGQLLRA